MASYLITGCSRGLGLAMVTDLASRPASEIKTIFATARKPTQELQQLISKHGDRVIYIPLDVTNRDSCQQAVSLVESELDGAGLDIVINNAACNPRATIDEMEDLEEALEVNVVSVRNTTRAFMPLLRKGNLKKVINISSALGSMTLAKQMSFAPGPAYKISKAALNMMTKQYSIAYSEEGFTFLGISPGYVKTSMGAPDADLTPDQSAAAILKWVHKSLPEDGGRFVDIEVPGFAMGSRRKYTGSDLPF